MTDITKPSTPKSSRSRILDTAQWAAQQQSVLADVEARISILNGESASILHEINDLQSLASAIRQGILVLDGTVAEFEQQQQIGKANVE